MQRVGGGGDEAMWRAAEGGHVEIVELCKEYFDSHEMCAGMVTSRSSSCAKSGGQWTLTKLCGGQLKMVTSKVSVQRVGSSGL